MELPAGVVNTFALDGEGKRRSIGEGQGVRSLVWDRENIVAEADNAGATVARYTLAPAAYGHLVSQRRSGV